MCVRFAKYVSARSSGNGAKTVWHYHGKLWRAAYFREVYPFIEPIIMNDSDFLSDYNSHAIAALCDYLEIESSKLVRSSQFNLQNNATDLLIDITKAVGAVRYFCGGGAQGYQEDEKFPRHGIQLIYQNFVTQSIRKRMMPFSARPINRGRSHALRPSWRN